MSSQRSNPREAGSKGTLSIPIGQASAANHRSPGLVLVRLSRRDFACVFQKHLRIIALRRIVERQLRFGVDIKRNPQRWRAGEGVEL
jgi:hypothetical protein